MADRFGESNNVLIKSFRENEKNKNTQHGKNSQLRLWKSEALKIDYKSINGGPEQILEGFQARVRKKDGKDYELGNCV